LQCSFGVLNSKDMGLGGLAMKPHRTAEDYRHEAARLREKADDTTRSSAQRIELVDMAAHYEVLAATAEQTHRRSHRLGRWLLPS
jgi:hypothetical protein